MNGIGPAGAFGFYAGICTLGLLFGMRAGGYQPHPLLMKPACTVIFFYPEVSGLSLEEIGMLFRTGFGIAKSREIRMSHRLAKEMATKGELAVRSGDDEQKF